MRQLRIEHRITNRTENTSRYLTDVANIDMISAEEEVALFEKIKQGDQAARDRIITANLRFVISVAKQYSNKPLLLEEYIAQGNLGLMKAVDNFEPSRGFKFISYAVWWIRQSIMAYQTRDSLIHCPLNLYNARAKVLKEIEKDGEYPRPFFDVANDLGFNAVNLSHVDNSFIPTSFDSSINDDDIRSRYEIVDNGDASIDDQIHKNSLRERLEAFVKANLKERDAYIVLQLANFDNRYRNSVDVANELGLDPVTIRTIHIRSLKRLNMLKTRFE